MLVRSFNEQLDLLLAPLLGLVNFHHPWGSKYAARDFKTVISIDRPIRYPAVPILLGGPMRPKFKLIQRICRLRLKGYAP